MATAGTQSEVKNSRVLIASSNQAFRRQWVGNPQNGAAEVMEAESGADALAKLESEDWGEVLLDRRLHDLDVQEVLSIIRSRHPDLVVRLVDSDEQPAKSRDGLAPPDDIAVCSSGIAWEETGELEKEIFEQWPDPYQKGENDTCSTGSEPLPGMMGTGPGLAQIFRLARLVAPRQTTVLITGETGTGKELVARGIHQISARAKNPFVVVNCAAIPEHLFEAELFGHVRGAFTGAVQSRLGRIHAAHGGTLFLDEVGELPLSMQAKLLRFLQDGEVQRLGSSDIFRVDVRVISATNVNLLHCVQAKQFRQDLYYRLAVFPLELPPLRERKEDVVALAQHFLNLLSEQAGVPRRELMASAASALRKYVWPGNVRELQHMVERAFILAGEERQLRACYFNIPGLPSL
jgi:transcriptional regulator with GAF, ATPase, and Fis domain